MAEEMTEEQKKSSAKLAIMLGLAAVAFFFMGFYFSNASM